MITAEQKPIEEIRRMLAPFGRILAVGCASCVAECAAGGEKETAALAALLRMQDKMAGEPRRIDEVTLDRQCVETFVLQLDDRVTDYDAVLSLGCGAGVQAVAAMYPDIPVIPALNTQFMGETRARGEWVENCIGCDDCMLYFFGGVCPLARCSKRLLNGPCGGSRDGRCEVNPEVDCAWQQIVDRLTALGALERLECIYPPKDWSRQQGVGPRRIVRPDQQE